VSYEPFELLARIDAHRVPILVGFAVDSVFQVGWLVLAFTVARRDRAYSIPLVCTYYWFAHDFAVMARYRQWFEVYDHWYLQFFWAVLSVACVLECLYLWQVYRYGHKELAPNLSRRAFGLLLLAGLFFACIAHEFFKAAFGDPLSQLDPTLTMLAYPAFGAAMLLRRRSARGQTPMMWWAFSAMAMGFPLITWTWFGDAFRTGPYVAASLLTVIAGVAMAVGLRHPRWRWDGSEFED
jgi:hypothetical protein